MPIRSATLIYGKAGVARANSQIDMAINNDLAAFAGPDITSNSTNTTFWGWTVGLGIEQALSAAWSLKVEYDYIGFPSRNIANLGSATVDQTATPLSATPAGSSGVSQNIQLVKLGLNYKWGTNPLLWGDAAPVASVVVRDAPVQNWLAGWNAEGGARYFGSWGRFQKDLGVFTSAGLPSITSVSRLTYSDMQTNSGELFGRIDSPWRVFVEGFIGTGANTGGQMNDEDFGIPLGATFAAYSNTISSVSGTINYGAIDAGVNLLDAPSHKVSAFAGYFFLNQDMNGFGCHPLANINCIPNVPTTGSAIISENDKWQAMRVGVSGETQVINRLRLSGDVAYLPVVNFSGVDTHFFGNTGQVAETAKAPACKSRRCCPTSSPRNSVSASAGAIGRCGRTTGRPTARSMTVRPSPRHHRRHSGQRSSRPAYSCKPPIGSDRTVFDAAITSNAVTPPWRLLFCARRCEVFFLERPAPCSLRFSRFKLSTVMSTGA